MKSTKNKSNKEKEIIERSIEKLIADVKKHQIIDFNEYDLQARLYYHLMNEFEKINDKDIWRIRLEHKPFDNKQKNKKDNWEKCYLNHRVNKSDEIEFDGKEGRYDLVIFDKNKKILHAIEIKIIDSCCDSLKHRGYEDIYVLSKLLQDNFKGSQGYIVIFARVSSKKMKTFLKNVKSTYEHAKVYCKYKILDNSNNK